MNKKELQKRLNQPYSQENWKDVVDFVFPNVSELSSNQSLPIEAKHQDKIESFKQLGNVRLNDGKNLALFELKLKENVNIIRNRVALNDIVSSYIDQEQIHGVLSIFEQGKEDYRFTFSARSSAFDEEAGDFVTKKTDTKRYTYVLGKNESCRTAAERFYQLSEEKDEADINTIQHAFSVETLSKTFFKEYKQQYELFVEYLTQRPNYYTAIFDNNDKAIRDWVKLLLGRLVFIKFVQKKGWLGIPASESGWRNGNYRFVEESFEKFEHQDNFYSTFLNPLFFEGFDTPNRPNDVFSLTNTKVPFLSGGLFDNEDPKTKLINFPKAYFEGLFEFLERYNFTIDENDTALDREVGIDPEMLGHIFENLLEDNKDKGAFYTPKEIVRYMCQESLIEYLKTYLKGQKQWSSDETKQKELEDSLHKFVTLKEAAGVIDLDATLAMALKVVKICDPAIGSGAFPMGLLNEIFQLVHKLYEASPDKVGDIWEMKTWQPDTVKLNIIQQSIYGVDIEKGAVDTARLRFWLSLIVDSDEPHALPHLDYKIVVGDSLLSKLENTVINIDWNLKEDSNEKDLFGKTKAKQYNAFSAENESINKLLLKQISEKQKQVFEPDSDDEKLGLGIRNLKIDLLKNQLELMIKTQGLVNKPEVSSKNLKKQTELWLKTLEWKELINKLNQMRKGAKTPLAFFDWKLDFPEVLNEEIAPNKGFDIVIGNPPYFQIQKLDKNYKEELQKEDFQTFTRTGDIYCLFYEKGFHLLKDKGTLVYITSNKWMKGGYGKGLRKFFTQINSNEIINLGPSIFHSATVDTNIYIGRNEPFKNEVKGISVKKRKEVLQLSKEDFIPIKNPNEEAWIVLDEIDLSIAKSFEANGKPLKEWSLKINFGIKTGFNEAFIINQAKRDELVKKEAKSDEIIKPILKGREIQRYYAEWSDDYIINTHNGVKELDILPIDINEYVTIKDYLESENLWYKVQNRQDQGDTPYNLRNCAYLNEFKKEKVIWKRIGSIMRFAYSNEEIYCLDSTCIATGEKIKYLTAILNSKPGLYQLIKTSPQTGTGDQIISVQALAPLFVHYPDSETEEKFNILVDYIIFIKKQKEPIIKGIENQMISKLFETVVDMMAFELYFEKHMKEKQIDVLKFIDFPELNSQMKIHEIKKIIEQQYAHLNKTDNQIRNRILLSTTRSPDIINRITLATV